MTKPIKKTASHGPTPLPDDRVTQIQKLWTSLVESAFDFFERAVREHSKSPKYAILHLAASVELFLKARLMAEHWTLIVSPKESPTFDQLRAGEFVSVTMSESIKRIQGVLASEESISKDAATEFSALAAERNKIAHFFHSGLDAEESAKSIIQRQCRVWLYLHRLLAEAWQSTFSRFESRLKALDRKMREERKFLRTIFESVKPDLEKHRAAGLPVVKCPACEFRALTLKEVAPYTGGQCLVCRYQNRLMRIECPDCAKTVLIEHGYDHCPECNHAFTPHESGDLIGGTRPEDDTGFLRLPINCSECGTDEVYEVNGRYVCMNCMEEWDEIAECQWCNEYNTGDMEMSYVHGCSMCEGMVGWKGDRD